MRKFKKGFQDHSRLMYSRARTTALYRWTSPLFDPFKLIAAIPGYIGFFRDWIRYSQLPGAELIRIPDTYPCIHDKTQTTGFDAHYFYQDVWAFKMIYEA
jgi:hypothetical protein